MLSTATIFAVNEHPRCMRAIQIKQYGDNSVLEAVEIAVPSPMPGQVLVRLKASSVNPVDHKIRSGYLSGGLPKSFPFTLGWEGAGLITELGEGVQGFQVHDEVMLMPNFMQGGTYAEFVAVNADEVMPKPKSVPFTDASVVPFSLGTAYTALVEEARIKAGQRLLIHGAGGAVGQMAVQIAKHVGLHVIGTAKGEALREIKALGIDQTIDYESTDFSTVATNMDVVLDLVGGATLAKSYALVNKGGVVISTAQPPDSAELKSHGINGKMIQTRYSPERFAEPLQWLEAGRIKVKPPQVISLSEAKEALALVEGRKATAKMVIEFR